MKIRGVSIYKPKNRARKSDPWLIAYGPRDARKVIQGSTDKNVTIELASKIARTAERVRLGLASADELRFEQQATRPIVDHLADYEAHLIDQGRDPKHALQMRTYAAKILAGAGVRVIGDLVSSLLQRELAKLGTREGERAGGATKNRHVAAVRAFITWGVQDVRWPQAVADQVRLTKFTAGDKRPRRVLALEQLAEVIAAAEAGPVVENVDGPTRSLIYRLVVASGLRANELRTLTAADIHPLGVRVLAVNAKNRKQVTIRLPAELMAELADRVATMKPAERVFKVNENVHRMLKTDLAAAGIPYTTPAGTFDFHALRHQCGSMLAAAGLPVKAVQMHMRHASAKMTLDVYGHLFDQDQARSVDTIGTICQRLAQRNGVAESADMSRKEPPNMPFQAKNQWSDGESNPDLLNAIQPSSR